MSRKIPSHKFFLIASCAIGLAAPAHAADLALPPPPPPPAFTWTGVYLGAQIGYVWGYNTGNIAFVTPGGLFGGLALIGDTQGVIGGGHLGYNLQFNQCVIGIDG